MVLSAKESLYIIFICVACTQLERALPFLIFGNRPVPRVVEYLGKILPMAVMATLVIYCLKDVSFYQTSQFVPPLLAVSITILLHVWKRNTLLSIAGGTASYMLLVQFIFV